MENSISEEYLRAFFGSNADYYLDKWQQREAGQRLTFNGSAFLAGIFWFAYRRMYRVLALILVFLFAEAFVEELLFPGDNPSRQVLMMVAYSFFYSVFGNWLYLRYADRKIGQILRTNEAEEVRLVRLRKSGGTSWWFLLVVLGVGAALLGLYVWLGQQPAQ